MKLLKRSDMYYFISILIAAILTTIAACSGKIDRSPSKEDIQAQFESIQLKLEDYKELVKTYKGE